MAQISSAFGCIWRVLDKKERFYFISVLFLCSLRAFSYLSFAQMLACLTAKASGNPVYFFGIPFSDNLSFLAVSAICCVLVAFCYIYSTFSRNLMQRFSEGIARPKYREHALQEILALRKNMDLKHSNGEVIYIVESSAESVTQFIQTISLNIVPYVVSSIIAAAYLFSINTIVGGVALAVAVVMFFLALWRSIQDRKLFREIDQITSNINNNISNCVNNLPFISFINSSMHELIILKEKHKNINKIVSKRMNIHMIYWAVIDVFKYAFIFLAIYFLLSQYGFAVIGIDIIILLVSYLDRLFSPINDLGHNLNYLVNCATRVCRLTELSPLPEEKLDQEAKLQQEKKKVRYLRRHKIKKIEMKDISIDIGQFQKSDINATLRQGKLPA